MSGRDHSQSSPSHAALLAAVDACKPAIQDAIARDIRARYSDAHGVIMGGVDHGDSWAHAPFPEEDLVPSPGGWTASAGERPGWDWVPPCGATPVPERTAWWIRALYRTPFLDRYAHQVMWVRGGFLVLPPDHPWLQRES